VCVCMCVHVRGMIRNKGRLKRHTIMYPELTTKEEVIKRTHNY